MKRCVVVPAALGLAASIAGCGGLAAREASSLQLETGAGQIRGIDVWNSVEKIFPRHKVVYQENKAVNLLRKDLAVTLQDTPAPSLAGAASPPTFESAARDLVAALDDSRALGESDLSYEAVEELAKRSAKVLQHAREAVKALEVKDLELRLAGNDGKDGDTGGVWRGANVASEEDEARALVKHWMPRAKLIEQNATNLWSFAATHRKAGIGEWSLALRNSCRELEETYAARSRRRRRPRPETGAETETREDGTGKPGEGVEEKPEGGPDEGPAKAETPSAEEQPETGSGTPPAGKDGDSKPDAGPPQVGAFLLGVAGRRRSSRSRSRSRRRAG